MREQGRAVGGEVERFGGKSTRDKRIYIVIKISSTILVETCY
jgi:hypothetical protein